MYNFSLFVFWIGTFVFLSFFKMFSSSLVFDNWYLFEETSIHCSIADVDKRIEIAQDDWHQNKKFCCNQTLHFDRTNPFRVNVLFQCSNLKHRDLVITTGLATQTYQKSGKCKENFALCCNNNKMLHDPDQISCEATSWLDTLIVDSMHFYRNLLECYMNWPATKCLLSPE